jgi:hypothetical protein
MKTLKAAEFNPGDKISGNILRQVVSYKEGRRTLSLILGSVDVNGVPLPTDEYQYFLSNRADDWFWDLFSRKHLTWEGAVGARVTIEKQSYMVNWPAGIYHTVEAFVPISLEVPT